MNSMRSFGTVGSETSPNLRFLAQVNPAIVCGGDPMKYDNKFPHARPDDDKEYDRCMIKLSRSEPCFVCGSRTQWVDIDYQCFICSEECQLSVAEDAARCGIPH